MNYTHFVRTLFSLTSALVVLPQSLTAMEQPGDVSNLPAEMKELISSHLDVKSLSALSEVNHDFQDVANSDHLWHELYLEKKAKVLAEIESYKPFLNDPTDGNDDTFLMGYERFQTFYSAAKNSITDDAKPEGISWKEHYKNVFVPHAFPLNVDRSVIDSHKVYTVKLSPLGYDYEFPVAKVNKPQLQAMKLTQKELSQPVTVHLESGKARLGGYLKEKGVVVGNLAPEMMFLSPELGTLEAVSVSLKKYTPFNGNLLYTLQLTDGTMAEARYLKTNKKYDIYQLSTLDGKSLRKLKFSSKTKELKDKSSCVIS